MTKARLALTATAVDRTVMSQLTAVIHGLRELHQHSREPLQLRRLSQAIALLHAAVDVLELPVGPRAWEQ